MTDRGLPSADGSPACPFVALEDDRDARADRPDHRHRCFAEAQPAPRALAHQEAYCLSSASPVCPTFQDWARREAAHAIPGAEGHGESASAASAAAIDATDRDGDVDDDEDPWSRPPQDVPIEERPRRNPPRDWAAPPPWASSGAAAAASGAAGSAGAPRDATPSYLGSSEEGQGLAGSAADRLARGEDLDADWAARPPDRPVWTPADAPSSPADPDLAGLVGRAAYQAEAAESHVEVRPPTKPGRRPTVSSTRDKSRERDRAAATAAGAAAASQHEGPSWEKARRYEAYPSIKTRAGLSGISGVPTIAILAGGVVLAAVILFFLPGVLGVGREGGGGGAVSSSSPSSSVERSASPSPTAIPAPTPQLYTIKTGDTLSKIARKFNVSLDALLAANKATIKNPNRIQVGDEIIIPLPETQEVPAEASPSAS